MVFTVSNGVWLLLSLGFSYYKPAIWFGVPHYSVDIPQV